MPRRRLGPETATLAQVKALAAPLRYRIFEELVAEPRTAMQIAQRLGIPPTRLYHHFRVLERAGLVRPSGTRQKRGTTEKYYAATVDRIEAHARRTASPAVAAALVEGALASALAEIRGVGRRPRRGGGASPKMYLKRYRLRATAEQAAEIQVRLDSLADFCERLAAPAASPAYSVTLACCETPATPRRRTRR